MAWPFVTLHRKRGRYLQEWGVLWGVLGGLRACATRRNPSSMGNSQRAIRFTPGCPMALPDIVIYISSCSTPADGAKPGGRAQENVTEEAIAVAGQCRRRCRPFMELRGWHAPSLSILLACHRYAHHAPFRQFGALQCGPSSRQR